MKLTDIENLTAAELKSQSNELVEVARKSDPAEVASRYIKARTDAATRDEKLSEQGRTISLLQGSLENSQQELARIRQELAESEHRSVLLEQTIETQKKYHAERRTEQELTHETALKEAAKSIEDIQSQLNSALLWKTVAKSRRSVLADIVNRITPLLAEES